MADILILEDDTQLAQQWRRTLSGAGHRITLCACASEALAIVRETEFDLFIVDMLVRRNGAFVPDGGMILISNLRQMHRNSASWWRTAPVLAVTGAMALPNGFDPLRTARGMGAKMTLRKPVRALALLEAVHKLLKRSAGSDGEAADADGQSGDDGLSPA